jgi:hypothetical protein
MNKKCTKTLTIVVQYQLVQRHCWIGMQKVQHLQTTQNKLYYPGAEGKYIALLSLISSRFGKLNSLEFGAHLDNAFQRHRKHKDSSLQRRSSSQPSFVVRPIITGKMEVSPWRVRGSRSAEWIFGRKELNYVDCAACTHRTIHIVQFQLIRDTNRQQRG